MSRNLIRDGYTKSGRIAEVELIHGELRFEYRPMLAADVELVEREVGKRIAADKPREATQIIAGAITKQLVSWSEEEENGSPVALKPENVARLPYLLLYKLFNIIKGISPSDPIESSQADPDSPDLMAYLGVSNPGLVELADDQKN